MSSALRLGFLAATLALAFSWMTMQPAFAERGPQPGLFVMRPCDTDSSLDRVFQIQVYANMWLLDDECPARLVLRTSAVVDPMFKQGWRYEIGRERQADIDSVSVNARIVEQPIGKRIRLAVCGLECGTAVELPIGDAQLNVELTRSGGDVPGDAKFFQLSADCVNPDGCAAEGRVELSGLKITIRDPGRPTADWTDGWEGDYLHMSFKEGVWLPAGTAPIYLLSSDEGTGVESMTVRLGNDVTEFQGICGPWPMGLQTGWCWTTGGDWYYEIVTTSLPDGWHQLVLTAHDPAGNDSEPRVSRFGVDKVRPPIPTNLLVDEMTPAGWVKDSHVTVRWINTAETSETATSSGIVRAAYRAPSNQPYGIASTEYVDGDNVSAIHGLKINEGTNRVLVAAIDRAGNSSQFATVFIRRDSTKLDAPGVVGPQLVGAAGGALTWSRPPNANAVPSGICGYAINVSIAPESDPGEAITVQGDVTSTQLVSTPEGLSYAHVRAVSCSGVPGEITNSPVFTDRAAPTIQTSKPPGEWMAGADRLKLSASDVGLGVASIAYQVDGGVTVTRPERQLLVELDAGWHTLRYWATDAAGNASDPIETELGVDPEPPMGYFSAPDPTRPRFVRGRVTDELSGIKSVHLEYRRQAVDEDWQPLGSPQNVDGANGVHEAVVAAEFPDSAEAQAYEMRLVAADRAGNQAVSNVYADGSIAGIVTPLRAAPVLSAVLTAGRGCRSRRICIVSSQRARVPLGARVALRGRLTDAGGQPMPDVSLELTEVTGSVVRRSGSIQTDQLGRFRHIVPGRSSRRLFVRYSGSDALQPVGKELWIDVRPAVSLIVRQRRSDLGTVVWLSGGVDPGDAALPAGHPVVIEFRARGRWRNLMPGTRVLTRQDGSFAVGYSPGRTQVPLRFHVRARVPAGANWPFATGVSPVRRFVVRPVRG